MALSRGTGLGGSGLSDGLPNLGGSGGEDRFDPTASFAPGANSAWDFINNYARFKDVYYGPLANTPGWSFTRASTGYAQTSAGALTAFASGELRRTDKGVLIEGARTNLCLQSEDFSTTWTNTASTESVNTATAPNGLLTADKLIEDATAASTHRLFQSITTTAAAHCFSVYAKAGERSWIYLRFNNSVPESCYAWFNLATGVVGSVSGTGATGSIESIGNGWYRCVLKIATANNASNTVVIGLTTADAVSDYNGDGTSGVYLWGAQLELGAFPSSYIPTTTASATRAADVLTVPVSGIDYPLSLYAETQIDVHIGGTNRVYLQIDDGSANNRAVVYGTPGAGVASRLYTAAASINTAQISVGTLAAGAIRKTAARSALNDFQVAGNGTLGSADTSGAQAATPTTLRFGKENGSGTELFGYLRRAAIWTRALTDAELQAVTT